MVRRSTTLIALLLAGAVLGSAWPAHADEGEAQAPQAEAPAVLEKLARLRHTLDELKRATEKARQAGDAEAARRLEATAKALRHVLQELRGEAQTVSKPAAPPSAGAPEATSALRERATDLRREIEALAKRRALLREQLGMRRPILLRSEDGTIGLGGMRAPAAKDEVVEEAIIVDENVVEEGVREDHDVVIGGAKPGHRVRIVRSRRPAAFDVDVEKDEKGHTTIRIRTTREGSLNPSDRARLYDLLARHLGGTLPPRPAPVRVRRPAPSGPAVPAPAAGGPSMVDLLRRLERLEGEVRRLRAERGQARMPRRSGNAATSEQRLERIESLLLRLLHTGGAEGPAHDHAPRGESRAPGVDGPRRRVPVPPVAPRPGR